MLPVGTGAKGNDAKPPSSFFSPLATIISASLVEALKLQRPLADASGSRIKQLIAPRKPEPTAPVQLPAMAGDGPQRFVLLNRLVSRSVTRAPEEHKPPMESGAELLTVIEKRRTS
jgi:hypothetical protein